MVLILVMGGYKVVVIDLDLEVFGLSIVFKFK